MISLFLRDAWDFHNVLLVEQPNGDFAHTIVRQFLFDVFHFLLKPGIDPKSRSSFGCNRSKINKRSDLSSTVQLRMDDPFGATVRRKVIGECKTRWKIYGCIPES